MKLRNWKGVLLLVLIGQFFSCKEAFDPSLETPALNFLVVEGFINTKGTTVIQLTRTQKLGEASLIKKELKATVQIENDNSLVVGLTEGDPGVYRSTALNLPSDRKYRLRIKTSEGKEYLSEYTSVKTTPKLNLTWERTDAGVTIYANSADPTGQTLYYKYDTEETWSLRSTHLSEMIATELSNGNIAVGPRPAQDQIDALICWTSALSNAVLTVSTAALSQDVVDKFPVMFIPKDTEKLAIRYSILVKQYALTKEAFGFFEQMKKNTELLGSVFDPLPSTIRGNIQCINDPSEPVVGNIVTASAEEQRIFIEKEAVPNWGFAVPCGIEYMGLGQANLRLFLRFDRYLVKNADFDDNGSVRGYYISNPACLDCRKRNGNNIKPSFW